MWKEGRPSAYSALARAALVAPTRVECIGHVIGRRITIAERRESPTVLDQRQNRRCVIAVVIDKVTFGERRDNERRHPDTRAPTIDHGRGHVIPKAAMLVVCDDDRGGRPVGPVPN